MKATLHKYGIIAPVIIIVVICFSFSSMCLGLSEEEKRMINMFYGDKNFVVSSTRSSKPISQVAENITVITADDIESMNAHTVAEVLDSVPGMFMSFNRDYGTNSLINLQGAEPRHTLVLVDDVPINSIGESSAEVITVPVGIIERIEIVKGPASSAWGSSLGGVINIITKQAGTGKEPSGSAYAAYGKNNSFDYRADISGKAGKAGYYLYAGILESDGLADKRFSDNENMYSKIIFSPSEKIDAGVRIGYSNSYVGLGDSIEYDINTSGTIKLFFTSPYLNAKITDDLELTFSAFFTNREISQRNTALGLGIAGIKGDLYLDTVFNEENWGGKGKIVWEKGANSIVMGVDFEKGEYSQVHTSGQVLRTWGAPAVSVFSPDDSKWAIYVNDTISIGEWSLIPGLRYDHESVTGSFVSPSLGVTYTHFENTVIRGTVSRGFSTPPLLWTSGGGLFTDPNQALKYEEIWSYQAGIESAYPFFWVKANIFFHDIRNSIVKESYGGGPPSFYDIYINKGNIKRKGVEIEFETSPVFNVSFHGGISYIDINPPANTGASEMYSYITGIKYDNSTMSAILSGKYNWYDLNYLSDASYNDFIWDLNIVKEINIDEKAAMELFLSAHNIFNGYMYYNNVSINPRKWLEAGIKFRF